MSMTKEVVGTALKLLHERLRGCIGVIGDHLVVGKRQFFTDGQKVMVDTDFCTGPESRHRDDLGENPAETPMNQSTRQVNQIPDRKFVYSKQMRSEFSVDIACFDGGDMRTGEYRSFRLDHLHQIELIESTIDWMVVGE
jgi:hypothetical protein